MPFYFSQYSGVQKVFRCQFFVGCSDKHVVRYNKEDMDDACLRKSIPDDFCMDLFFRFQDNGGDRHPLTSYIPAHDVSQLSGETCYFRDPERNERYMVAK